MLGAALLAFGSGLALAQVPEEDEQIERRLRELSRPLASARDLDPLLAAAAGARVVLLGEATHGTREFYRWRSLLTRRLIAEQGVRLVAVEGDWRPMLEINAYVRGAARANGAAAALGRIDRWPQWMWANAEFAELVEWLREWNRGRAADDQVQVFGLDLYGHGESLTQVEAFVARRLPHLAKEVHGHYGPLRRFDGDGQAYAAYLQGGGRSGGGGTQAVLERLRTSQAALEKVPPDERFAAIQDAWVVHRAEKFYRTMLEPGPASWNARAEHMWLTAQRLLDHQGPRSRLVAWAYNTHVGDARATDMHPGGLVNIGRLAREALGDDAVFLVGFATYRGEVVAGKAWEAPHRVLPLPHAREASWDDYLQRALGDDGWFLFDETARADPLLREPRPQRAVGVVYEPRRERLANYTQTILPERFDALLFVSNTRAVQPLR